jgi:hypothetical protein
MTLSRVVQLVLALALMPLGAAQAQFGGMPGMPGSMPGGPGAGFGAPQQPPPACQQLMVLREETNKHGQALQAASQGKKKPTAEEACKLFKAFLGAEAKMIKGLEQNSAACGVPADIIKSLKVTHTKASETGKNVCDAAARGPQPTGPSFSDALGSTPLVPDTGDRNKQGNGTFDTLTGNALQR